MISRRLLQVADMVDTKNIYDVGCDHALLDIYLTLEKNVNCIAIDISEKNIFKAKQNIIKNKVNVTVIVNNGLENINIIPNSSVILSGLGTKTILKIIENKDIDSIIIQSNNNLFELRNKMNNAGYIIDKETILFDKKFYITIKFKKGKIKYNEKQLYLGPCLLNQSNDIIKKYYTHLKNVCFKITDKMDDKKRNLYSRLQEYISEENI